MTNELEAILSALEPEAAADLPPGYRLGRMLDMAIGPPTVAYETRTRGNKVTKVLTPESRKLLRAYESMRWPVLDRSSPDTLAVWEQHAQAVHADQERARLANAPAVPPTPEQRPMPSMRIVRI